MFPKSGASLITHWKTFRSQTLAACTIGFHHELSIELRFNHCIIKEIVCFSNLCACCGLKCWNQSVNMFAFCLSFESWLCNYYLVRAPFPAWWWQLQFVNNKLTQQIFRFFPLYAFFSLQWSRVVGRLLKMGQSTFYLKHLLCLYWFLVFCNIIICTDWTAVQWTTYLAATYKAETAYIAD